MNRFAIIPAVLLLIGCGESTARADSRHEKAGKNEGGGGPPAVTGPALERVSAVFTSADGRRTSFNLEIADVPDTRAKGLMFRRSMGSNEGMVFVFPKSEDQTFYMKNTYIPLDMVFVDEYGVVVGVVENARPLTLEIRSVGRPSRYVVELNASTARASGIVAGATIEFGRGLSATK